MKPALLIEFPDATAFSSGVTAVRAAGIEVFDAFTPFPVEGLGASLGGRRDGRRVRRLHACRRACWRRPRPTRWSSTAPSSPIRSIRGGRPHNSWPTFMMFPFEFGILSAGDLRAPRPVLGRPACRGSTILVFDIEGFERASQDRFLLAIAAAGRRRSSAGASRRSSSVWARSRSGRSA